MTSEIVYASIDEEYPVAGVDNDTQGFRDNFSIIKTALGTAQSEITDLQNSSAKLDQANDFAGTNIVDANFSACTEQHYDPGTFSNNSEINFENGHYQVIKINPEADTISFTLTGWPTENRLGRMYVHLYAVDTGGGSVTKTVNFVVTSGVLKKDSGWPASITLDTVNNDVSSGDPVILEFWTYNSGNVVYARYLGEFSSD